MYKLKSIAKRGVTLSAGLALIVASFLPPSLAAADSLNPLTDRSLTLSSSSPGWSFTDGSGNTTYAPPNSGANGQKTGNYFSFKVSTDSTASGTNEPIKAMTFQYCTTSAGLCTAPGNNVVHGTDTATTSDLNLKYIGASEVGGSSVVSGTITTLANSTAVSGSGTTFLTDLAVGDHITTAGDHSYEVAAIADDTNLTLTTPVSSTDAEAGVTFVKGDFAAVVKSDGVVRAVPGYVNNNPKYQDLQGGVGDPQESAQNVTGSYIVMYKSGSTWTQSTGWTITTSDQEDGSSPTGQQNTIVLSNSTGLGIPAGTEMKVLFFANNSYYITNPGAGAFYVKINTYKDFTPLAPASPGPEVTLADNYDNIVDGGVTVANVMNQSIQITTKVLETMQFSVGTVDPNTLDSTGGSTGGGGTGSPLWLATHDPGNETDYPGLAKHGTCDPILTAMKVGDPQNVLELGRQDAESSLEVAQTYATHSYWRLSSNSSAGATVYYSGHTLSNTVGDEILPIGDTPDTAHPGTEQFGLAIANGDGIDHTADPGPDFTKYAVNYNQQATYENAADNGKTGVDASVATDLSGNGSYHTPQLYPLVPDTNYNGHYGTGLMSTSYLPSTYAFDPSSDTVPVKIASEDTQVVDCVTAKMRYIANIAATTPAGIYTTKINYIAAPQY